MATGTIKNNGWKLLWTNPNPTASFAAQDVLVDLSNVNLVAIQYRNSTSNAAIDLTTIAKVGDKGNASVFNWSLNFRSYEIFSNKVTFTGATYYNAVAQSGTQNNALLIPIRIYSVP